MKIANLGKAAGVRAIALAVVSAFCVLAANAELVAKWDFNGFDQENPASTNVLLATLGGAGKPCYFVGAGTSMVDDGTLGEMYVVHPGYSGEDSSAVSAAAGLAAGNCAIAIPKSSHIALPIPDAVKNHEWTLKMRFYYPRTGVWHSLFNRGGNTTDGDSFIRTDNKLGGGQFKVNNNYAVTVSPGTWHTVSYSSRSNYWEVVVDGDTLAPYGNNSFRFNYFADPEEPLCDIDGVGHLLLCADENGEDDIMYIDYVELYDNFGAENIRTGEWTFPDGALDAVVGTSLVKFTREPGTTNFVEGTDSGIVGDDGYLGTARYNNLKCYHQLGNNSDYTVVMDVRVPDNANRTQRWHALFMGTDFAAGNGDADLFIEYNSGELKIHAVSETSYSLGAGFGEWVRITVAYENMTAKTIYVNGARINRTTVNAGWMRSQSGGYFSILGDNDGEDWDTDISYLAVYRGMMSDGKIAAFHSTPLGVSSYVPSGIQPPAPTVSVSHPGGQVAVNHTPVTFTVSASHSGGEHLKYRVFYGDGTCETSDDLVPSGTEKAFSHVYAKTGTYSPFVVAISQYGIESETTLAGPVEVTPKPGICVSVR